MIQGRCDNEFAGLDIDGNGVITPADDVDDDDIIDTQRDSQTRDSQR